LIYDVIVIGSGAAGIMASITATQIKKNVLLLEQLPRIATKLKATGGGRCNLTNTLPQNTFMEKFGKNGRFLTDALNAFSSQDLTTFMKSIGVDTHALDGFRIFPVGHNSQTIIDALIVEMERVSIQIELNQKVIKVSKEDDIFTITTQTNQFQTKTLIIATGGKGYEKLGATGEGYEIAKSLGHSVTKLYPAMMPLFVKESWVASCTADTIGKAELVVNLKKYHNKKATGDLIFTKDGIRGPVVLDFAREITPLFDEFDEIPISLNLIKGKDENYLLELFKINSGKKLVDVLEEILPKSIISSLCQFYNIDCMIEYKKLNGNDKTKLLQILTKTPLTISGNEGFKLAMITRGGIHLKEINPTSMESKIVSNLYFAGEILDIDGPCGGYNLQWAFSSGFLAGLLK
jgi:predicted Rossmann fold flavoprotein